MTVTTQNQREYQKIPKIILIEWVSILAIFISCFLFLFHEMKHIESKIDQQSNRTDRLYEMFIDLLKEKRT